MVKFIKINNEDNVAVALSDIEAHEDNIIIDVNAIDLPQAIKQVHKFALKDI